MEQAFADGGFWAELFDTDGAKTYWKKTKGVADQVVIAHLLPEVV